MQKSIDIQNYALFTLSKTVLEIEHKIYPMAIKAFCENKIKIINNRVIIEQ